MVNVVNVRTETSFTLHVNIGKKDLASKNF